MTLRPVNEYIPSRYISLSHQSDGAVVVHCSRTGAIGTVEANQAEAARRFLVRDTVSTRDDHPIINDLIAGGFLIPRGLDEEALQFHQYARRYVDKSLHLIIMPTEQCNFRCVYCYEEFKRPQMRSDVVTGIKRLVDSEDLESLSVSWFGGEPLLAGDVVLDLTDHMRRACEAKGANFACLATTNGSLLTRAYADAVIPAGLRQFQITLDGLEHEHDKRRVGARGEKTFQTIWDNLLYLRDSRHDFQVMIRHNFDPHSHERFADFLIELSREFGSDSRFTMELATIGKWGGANDEQLEVFEGRDSVRATLRNKRMALEAGFPDAISIQKMQPSGAVCYAANPRSFVIGPNGDVHKCTVELDYHDRNIVGQINADGRLSLDWSKMALWCETNGSSFDEPTKCSSCYFNPSCHGAVCPKEWMEQDECDCPNAKQTIRETLTLIREETLFRRIL